MTSTSSRCDQLFFFLLLTANLQDVYVQNMQLLAFSSVICAHSLVYIYLDLPAIFRIWKLRCAALLQMNAENTSTKTAFEYFKLSK
jgi:hypothetical protein